MSGMNINISRADLSVELEDCAAMADFMADAVAIVFGEEGEGAGTAAGQVPFGAGLCLKLLRDKLKSLSERI